MKRIATILILFAYLIPVVGFSFEIHWCGNKITSLDIFNNDHIDKCSCGKEMPMDCCKDIHVSVKGTDNQKISSRLLAPTDNFIKLFSEIIFQKKIFLFSQVEIFDVINNHSPPFKSKQPAYLNNCIFRI